MLIFKMIGCILKIKVAGKAMTTKIIEFTDLIIPEQSNLIKALHAVGVCDWLQDSVEFKFKGRKYRIAESVLEILDRYGWIWVEDSDFGDMISNPEDIKPLSKWTEEEIEAAKNDSFRFKYVSKDSDAEGKVILWQHKPTYEDRNVIYRGNLSWLIISNTDYPSLQSGECIALEHIR